MLGLSSAVRIFVCLEATDMRRSFDGLAAMVENVVGQDPLSGHLFLFRNRGRDRVKILYWDTDGLCIWYKRLEEGTFQLPEQAQTASGPSSDVPAHCEIHSDELAMLLGGVDLSSVKRRKRYRRTAAAI